MQLADNMSLFASASEHYSLIRTPGYPAVLWFLRWLFGREPAAWVLPQTLMAIATALLLVKVLEELMPLTLSNSAYYAGLLLLVDFSSTHLATLAITETLFTLFFVAGILSWARAWYHDRLALSALSGALFGAALLTRPVLLLFAPVVLVIHFAARQLKPRRRLFHAALLVGVLVGVGGTWVAYNHHRSGHAIFCAIDGESLLFYRAAPTLARARGTSLGASKAELAKLLGSDPFERRATELRLGRKILAEHPIDFVAITVRGAATMIFGPGLAGLHEWFGALAPVLAVGVLLQLVLVYGAALWGTVFLWRSGAISLLVPLLTGWLYLVAVSSGGESYSRFRVPWMPLACALAGVGCARAQAALSARKLKHVAL